MSSYADAHMLRRQHDFMGALSHARPSTPPAGGGRGSPAPSSRAGAGGGGQATTAWQEWSSRAAAAPADPTSARGPARYRSLETSSPNCWMCGKNCTAYGWCQVNSSLVHRISFYPASLFTLCNTCGKAMSLAPGTSLVDVVQRCNPTAYSKQHSHSFVSFLREYMVTLEAIHLDMEDEMAQGTLSSSYGRHNATTTPTRSTTAVGGSVRRDQVVLHPVAIDSLLRCISDTLSDRESLTLKESHLLMSEGASLQVQADQAAQRQARQHYVQPSPGPSRAARALSPEQQFVRAHPLLGLNGSDGIFSMAHAAATPPPNQYARGATAYSSGYDSASGPSAAGPSVRGTDQDGADVVVINGRRFVATPSETPAPQQQQPQQTPRHHAGLSSSSVGLAAGAASGTTARLLEAAEQWATQEQEFQLKLEDWNAEREDLKRHLAAAQNEARVLRERMAVKDKENDSLVLRTSQLSERLALLDSSSTLQAHMRLLATMARNVSNLAADAAAEKAKLFAESSLVVVRQSVATARQMKKLKEELEQTKLHVRQQQKMLEASRRAVLNAWSEKSGIGTDASLTAPAIGSMAPDASAGRGRTTVGVTFASTVFGLPTPSNAASTLGVIDESEDTTLF